MTTTEMITFELSDANLVLLKAYATAEQLPVDKAALKLIEVGIVQEMLKLGTQLGIIAAQDLKRRQEWAIYNNGDGTFTARVELDGEPLNHEHMIDDLEFARSKFIEVGMLVYPPRPDDPANVIERWK